MSKPLFPFTLLALLVLPLAAQDRGADTHLAFARAQHLRHGINASEWFAQSPADYSAARTGRYTDSQDIALMARLGFDHVRLSIDPEPILSAPYGPDGLNADFLARLDRAVDAMISNNLAVLVDIHPEDSYKQRLFSGDDAVDRLANLWRRLATHYASRNPDLVFFEIMNEPELRDAYRWLGIQACIAAVIRGVAPRHTIVAAGPNYSGIADLLAIQPLPDGNVIYNFHFYEPHQFTHQGASWGEPWWINTHGIPYPASEDSMSAILQQVPDPIGRYKLENYWLDRWDARHIRLLIDEAAAWARGYNVPLICNEFGVYRNYVDATSRMNWIRDVRTALEADGIGWTMWDYRGGFGVVYKHDGEPAQVDGAVVQALGLRPH